MATSRSNESDRWVATVALFSGRRDPQWDLPEYAARQLEALWDELPPYKDEAAEPPPPLGYRGVAVVRPDGVRLEAYGGVVTRQRGDDTETKADLDRRVEAIVIRSAPEGMAPESVLET